MIDRVIKMFKQVIYYFIAVVEQGSFSKAAKKFYLSQSAISQQITKLENDLGFSLFDRRTYYPTLTEEGKRYYDLAKKLLSDYKNEYNKTDLFDWDRNGFEKYTNIINREHFRTV